MKKAVNKMLFMLFISMAILGCSKDDDTNEDVDVNDEVLESDAKEILSFVFLTEDNNNLREAVTATINEAEKTITAVFPFETDVTNLTSSIVISQGASIDVTEAQYFTSAVTYIVTAEDESTVNYTVTVSTAALVPFVTKWQTTSDDESITIFIDDDLSGYNYQIDWGDGHSIVALTGNVTHSYATPGIHTVSIVGDFPAIYQGNEENAAKLVSIESWGDIVWQSMESAFEDCTNMVYNATDIPNLENVENVENMGNMFSGATSFNGDLSGWDVSSVTSMERMFDDATSFNGDLSGWDVSSVTSMERMFDDAKSFNADISNWDVGNVTNMAAMFSTAISFNADISDWDVSNVTDMKSMFFKAGVFSQDLSNWDTNNVLFCSGFSSFSGLLNLTAHLPTLGRCFGAD